MEEGIKQYQKLVTEAWNSCISYHVPSDIFIASNIQDLQAKTSKEFFGTGQHYPRAIALTQTSNPELFHPIILVSGTYSQNDLRGRELLKAAVLINYWLAGGMQGIKFADHPVEEYLLVRNNRLYPKNGLSEPEHTELTDFVQRMALCSQMFGSNDFSDREREILRQADLIGKGYAKELESRIQNKVGVSGRGDW